MGIEEEAQKRREELRRLEQAEQKRKDAFRQKQLDHVYQKIRRDAIEIMARTGSHSFSGRVEFGNPDTKIVEDGSERELFIITCQDWNNRGYSYGYSYQAPYTEVYIRRIRGNPGLWRDWFLDLDRMLRPEGLRITDIRIVAQIHWYYDGSNEYYEKAEESLYPDKDSEDFYLSPCDYTLRFSNDKKRTDSGLDQTIIFNYHYETPRNTNVSQSIQQIGSYVPVIPETYR